MQAEGGELDALKKADQKHRGRPERTTLMHGVLWPVTCGEICKHIRRTFLNQSAQRTKDGKKRNLITSPLCGSTTTGWIPLIGAEMESVVSFDQEIQT